LIPQESERSIKTIKRRKTAEPTATTSGAITTPALEGVPDLFPQLDEHSPEIDLTHPATGEKVAVGPSATAPEKQAAMVEKPGPPVNGDLEAQRHRVIREDDSDDSDDEDDDNEDTDEHAFDHPATYVEQTWVWVPKDPLGLSDMLVYDMKKAGVEASDKGASIDDRGVVEASRGPPDENWEGGQDD
jgi:hypothetical protein